MLNTFPVSLFTKQPLAFVTAQLSCDVKPAPNPATPVIFGAEPVPVFPAPPGVHQGALSLKSGTLNVGIKHRAKKKARHYSAPNVGKDIKPTLFLHTR